MFCSLAFKTIFKMFSILKSNIFFRTLKGFLKNDIDLAIDFNYQFYWLHWGKGWGRGERGGRGGGSIANTNDG